MPTRLHALAELASAIQCVNGSIVDHWSEVNRHFQDWVGQPGLRADLKSYLAELPSADFAALIGRSRETTTHFAWCLRAEGDDEWAVLSENDPKIKLYDRVVPIWCQMSHEWLEENAAQGFGLGFASGFMAGVLMAVLEQEWAAQFHASVRKYYLANGLTDEDLPWPRYAEATAHALPANWP